MIRDVFCLRQLEAEINWEEIYWKQISLKKMSALPIITARSTASPKVSLFYLKSVGMFKIGNSGA